MLSIEDFYTFGCWWLCLEADDNGFSQFAYNGATCVLIVVFALMSTSMKKEIKHIRMNA